MTTALRTHCAVCWHPEFGDGIAYAGRLWMTVLFIDKKHDEITYPKGREQAEADGVVFGEFSDLERE